MCDRCKWSVFVSVCPAAVTVLLQLLIIDVLFPPQHPSFPVCPVGTKGTDKHTHIYTQHTHIHCKGFLFLRVCRSTQEGGEAEEAQTVAEVVKQEYAGGEKQRAKEG